MVVVPYIVAYVAIAVFIVALIARYFMWAKMPMHMRWELYPVAHEEGKADYGGSYLEEFQWWEKDRKPSLLGELKVMLPEILFLVALKEHNPKLWLRSFPFHFGLYLTIGSVALMLFMGVLGLASPDFVAGSNGQLLQSLTVVVGVAGLVLGIAGAIGLLHRRMTAPELQDFTTSSDIFNLVIFIIAFGCALLSFALVDRDGSTTMTFARNLVAFDMKAVPADGLALYLPMASVVLMSALTGYVPMTHMSHFVGKYFAYHAIRWNDAPNLAGGDQEEQIGELLGRPITWAAEHIQGGGRSWAEVCTENPAANADDKEGKK